MPNYSVHCSYIDCRDSSPRMNDKAFFSDKAFKVGNSYQNVPVSQKLFWIFDSIESFFILTSFDIPSQAPQVIKTTRW